MHAATPAEALTLPPPEQRPISLVLPTAAGGAMDIADHRGKAVLVMAFTTDNLLCQRMLRTLEAVARAHPDDLTVIAVAGDVATRREAETIVRAYGDVLDLHAVVLTLATEDVREGNTVLGRIEHVPTVFLVNRAGVIARRVEGHLSRQELEALVAPAMPPR